MFITNGKTLFGNTGLVISLLILIILVYFSYNKCYVNNIDGFNYGYTMPTMPPIMPTLNLPPSTYVPPSTFSMPLPTITKPIIPNIPSPQSVRIKVSGSTVVVNFSIDISYHIPNSFIVVLAQYDINKNNTGNNRFYLSNETVLNPSLITDNNNQSNSLSGSQANKQSNLCTIVNGKPLCQYVFTNLDIRDLSGNLYYYKLGVSALFKNNVNSPYVLPYNIGNRNKMFTLNESVDSQNLNDNCNKNNINASTYDDTISTADGQYELIKSQLGNYPDNLLLGSQTTTVGTLSDLVDKSMAQALLSVNVSTQLDSS